jgi:hypothetical protein
LAFYKEDGNTPWGQGVASFGTGPIPTGVEHYILPYGFSDALPPDDDYKMKIYQDGAEDEIFDYSDDYLTFSHGNTACDQVDYNSGSFSNYDHYYWRWAGIDQDDFRVDIVDSKVGISCDADDGYYHGIYSYVAPDFSSTCTYLEPTSNDEVIITSRAEYVGNNGSTAQFALAFYTKTTWIGNYGYADRWLFEFLPASGQFRLRFYDSQAGEIQTVMDWEGISSTIWNSQPGSSNEISIKLNYNNDTEVFVNGDLAVTYDNSVYNGVAPSVGTFFIWCANSTMLFDNIELTGPGNDDDDWPGRTNNSPASVPSINQLIPIDYQE